MIVHIGTASGESSAIIPAHQAGDLILLFAINDAGTSPAQEVGDTWVSKAATSPTYRAWRLSSKIATSSAETTGTWSNCHAMIVSVYRGVHTDNLDWSYGLGHAFWSNGSSTPATLGASNLYAEDSSDWIVSFFGLIQLVTLDAAPAGRVERIRSQVASGNPSWLSGLTVAAYDSGEGVATSTAKTVGWPDVANDSWASVSVTLIADPDYTGSPSFEINQDVTTINEGETVTFTVTGPDGTYYYRISDSGTAGAADIVGSSIGTGEVVISGGTGEFEITIRNDLNTEGAETLIIELHETETGLPTLLATADAVTINDTSTSADHSWSGITYVGGIEVVGETGIANEGQTVSVIITAEPPPPAGARLRMSVLGTVDDDDYSIAGGSSWVEFDGVAATVGWGVNVLADTTTEGSETLQIRARTGWPATDGDIVYESSIITINDTSQAAPTYAVTPDDTSVNEGDTVVFDAACTTVATGTVLYWTITGDLDDDDVVGGALSGTVEIDTGDIIASSGQFSITLANDLTTEGEETFAVEIRTGSIAGPVVATSDTITVADTSLTPPEYAVTAGASTVPEGGTVNFAVVTSWFTGDTLYWTVSGTASGDDFSEGASGSIAMSETTYPEKTGSQTLNVSTDALIEGPETFVFQLRTGSTSGPIVATSGTITIIDEAYSVTVDKTIATEGETVTFTVTALYSNPGEELAWDIIGTVDGADFTVTAMSGTLTLSGGTATISKTLVDDATADGAEYLYLQISRNESDGEVLAVSPAVLVRDATIDYDEWLGTQSGTRIVLVEMQHADGWVYFGNYPYISRPDDTSPNRPYDDKLADVIDIETRMDGDLTVGEISIYHDGTHNDWISNNWRGYTVRILMGQPNWSLDDFRLVAVCVNGGLETVERGRMRWAIYDRKAVLAKPLQTSIYDGGTGAPDGTGPVPIAIGSPFNVAPVLIDGTVHEYQLHEAAVVSLDPRDNGADVASSDTLGAGIFELSAAPAGTVTADVTTSNNTPALAVAWVCDRYGVDVDSVTVAALPSYDIGMYYSSPTTGAQVLTDICLSIGAYWLVGLDGEVEVYVLDEPAETTDFTLEAEDVVVGGLRMIGFDDPVKNLTLNYRRNFAPMARSTIAGSVITGDPDFAEELTREWRQETVTNTVTDFPLAGDLVLDSYLVDQADAAAEAARIASLRSVRRERWEVEAFASFADAQVGNTVKIINPRHGFETGRSGVIVAVSRSLTRNRVILEVMIPAEIES